MNSLPPDVAEIVLEIIQAGLLRIRAAGWEGDAGRCAVEADHIHNLPQLLRDYSPELLRFYWEVERSTFASQSSSRNANLAEFERLWERLGRHVEAATAAALAH